ncbi:MAG: extracellular matrix regulator RemB [Eubacteriales bacterium]
MFLHAGNGKNIREKDIIGIFDMDNATISPVTRKYLNSCDKKGDITSVSDDIPKSFILYRVGSKTAVCFSPLSTAALFGRLSGGGALKGTF